MDLGGSTFNIYLGGYTNEDFDYEINDKGDIINDAVYERALKVENRLNIKISSEWNNDYDNWPTVVRSAVTAGDSSIDFVCGDQLRTYKLTYEDILVDWNTLEYVNLDNPWWDDGIMEELNFGNKILMATGDIVISNLSQTCVLIFNKQMMTDNNLAYPYEMVNNGTWTSDKLVEYAKVVLNDIDSDGQYTADDVYGLSGWSNEIGMNFTAAYGIRFISKDENDLPVDTIYSELNNAKMQKITDMFATNGGAYENYKEWALDMDMFKAGRLLFEDTRFTSLSSFRGMTSDFGIIPHPKYDEEQESYNCRVSNVGTVVVIPNTNSRIVETSAVLEALAKESYYTTTPAFFDVSLTIKATRDDESEGMLSVIRNAKCYQCELTSWGQLKIMGMTQTGTNNFTTLYNSAKSAIAQEIEKMANAYTAQ